MLKPEVLFFPDRTVLLAYGTSEQMSRSVELLDCIAELRRAKDIYTPVQTQVAVPAEVEVEIV